jgi:hypothetical protein
MPIAGQDRITGNHLMRFIKDNDLSPHQASDLFGVGLSIIQRESCRGDAGIESRDICFLYRLFRDNPELIKDVNIKDFYESIGGKETISGPLFSLVLGKEQSAYARYFADENASSSQGVKRIIMYSMRVSGGSPALAFDLMKAIAIDEGLSRGFDVFEKRTWTPKEK